MKRLLTIFGMLVALLLAGLLVSNTIMESKPELKAEMRLTILPNTGTDKAIGMLSEQGLLQPQWFFRLASRYIIHVQGGVLYAGNYVITPGMTKGDILNKVFSGGKLSTVSVTFLEGQTVKEMAAIAAKQFDFKVQDFIALCKKDSLLRHYGIKAESAEGYLLPDTYEFYKGATADEVIHKLLEHHKTLWTPANKAKLEKLKMTRHELLTLASIVEAETPSPDEMPCIAGVYVNRLRDGWPLQADPTVAYSLGVKRPLTSRDLEYKSKYNTYQNPGLPPGPINNPGSAAISASLNPEKHDYYFFVAKGDGSGLHNFAENLATHNNNRIIYKRNLRNRN